MTTIKINSQASAMLSRSADRARAEKPLIRKTAERGVYSVRSSDGRNWYTVRCNSQDKTIGCNCPAQKPCKHIAAVAPFHSWLVSQERAALEQSAGAVDTLPGQVDYDGVDAVRYCSGCGFRYSTGSDGRCEHCRRNLPAVLEAERLAAIRAELWG